MAYVTNQQIMQDILVDMTYACASWIQQVKTSIKYNDLLGKSVEDKWYNCLECGGKLIIIDNEDYDKHEVDYKQLSKAISIIRKKPCFKDDTNWDEIFVNNIIQTAIFGEVIFD